MIPAEVLVAFSLSPDSPVQTLGEGHIHFSFRAREGEQDLVIQQINTDIFQQPEQLQASIFQATNVFQNHLPPNKESLEVQPSHDGTLFYRDQTGRYWRAFRMIQNSYVINQAPNPDEAFEATSAFGWLADCLHTEAAENYPPSIPNFHHLSSRSDAFLLACEENIFKRASDAIPEINFFHDWDRMIFREAYFRHHLPQRIIHNDTKINNVLFDQQRGQWKCVIDLDTLMPGLLLYDFGDMVRTFVSAVPEDEADESIELDLPVYSAIVRAYREYVEEWISPAEEESLLDGGKIMTYLMGMRFLTDFLQGDVYYQTEYPEHNLDRAKRQIAMFSALVRQEKELRDIFRKNWPKRS
ncbi:MAG: aminoglycoside phosphotransferase family protein [Bacteroidota bacterium]